MNSQNMMYEFRPEIARLSDYPHSDSGNWQVYWSIVFFRHSGLVIRHWYVSWPFEPQSGPRML